MTTIKVEALQICFASLPEGCYPRPRATCGRCSDGCAQGPCWRCDSQCQSAPHAMHCCATIDLSCSPHSLQIGSSGTWNGPSASTSLACKRLHTIGANVFRLRQIEVLKYATGTSGCPIHVCPSLLAFAIAEDASVNVKQNDLPSRVQEKDVPRGIGVHLVWIPFDVRMSLMVSGQNVLATRQYMPIDSTLQRKVPTTPQLRCLQV